MIMSDRSFDGKVCIVKDEYSYLEKEGGLPCEELRSILAILSKGFFHGAGRNLAIKTSSGLMKN